MYNEYRTIQTTDTSAPLYDDSQFKILRTA